jgi:hypothetical protein
VHDLKKQFPQDSALLCWAKHVKAVYDEAVAFAAQGPDPHLTPRHQHQARVAQQHAYEQHLWALCLPYVQQDVPQQTLWKRVESFLPELFVFVAILGVPAHNNLAERSVRPLVIARKISGGSRSPQGSTPRMGLASLFGTRDWRKVSILSPTALLSFLSRTLWCNPRHENTHFGLSFTIRS